MMINSFELAAYVVDLTCQVDQRKTGTDLDKLLSFHSRQE